ncbi:OLC1v1016125C1 [Oldenlandia corymbosa var. corymbosa]|uniref:OLC1v1016125C1 n=1 Tax=Oldenlandia corymbosa var. corymbosa TaxID=529605 RepID=A0AAV1E508_OLDCO|nr:OLC1v1016125C1 [Oldenlandia corymbosa var. corymbosa]
MKSEQLSESTLLKPLVTLSGSAADTVIGPPLGRVDIGVNESAYICRVSLPGVRGNDDKVKCNIERSGRVDIEGVVTESQFVKNSSKEFKIALQQLSPPGPFKISFNLPGPVDPRLSSISFKPGGILEVVVMKFRVPQLSANGMFEKWL